MKIQPVPKNLCDTFLQKIYFIIMFLVLLQLSFYIHNISRSCVDNVYAFKIMATKTEEG